MDQTVDARTAHRVLVIGAQGALGATTAMTFERAGWATHRAGRRPDDRPHFRQLDLDRPETFESAMSEVDVVVSSVPHLGMTAERHILRNGGLLLNLTDCPAPRAEELRSSVPSPKGTVVMNAGMVPGLTNLLVAELLSRHPDADEVQIAFTVSASGTAGRAGGEFAHRVLTAQRRHRTIQIPWPAPFGAQSSIEYAEGERGCLHETAGAQHVSTFMCFTDRALGTALMSVNRVGGMKTLPRAAFLAGRGKPVTEATREPVAVWVAVLRDGNRLNTAIVQCEGDYRTTASLALIFAELLLCRTPELLEAGAFSPEHLLDLEEVAPAVAERNIKLS